MAGISRKRSVWLVQQGVWDMPKESMPLGVGYLKASVLADESMRHEVDIQIFNFNGGDSVVSMAEAMFSGGPPDVVGFSVWGWNCRAFGHLSETIKMVSPDALVVFGGTHVANQAERVFRLFPAVDVVVNTEGEFVFKELLRAHLNGRPRTELGDIAGLSYRDGDGGVATTENPERIQDLDRIPSPILTGAFPLTDHTGEFRYDVALMETNRGCPYRCAFCYWGGAIGQKVRAFSRERLREELEVFARLQVHTVVLCDANFGMLRQDLDFVEDVIHLRERFGYPRAVQASWAKNKSKTFYEIVRRMKGQGMQSSFTLALQTLDDSALEVMQRKNMRLNEWEDLVDWLRKEGLDCYAELIWGAPGETPQSFLDGYDRLAKLVTRIAVYPLLLLPNTAYANSRKELGLLTVRGEHDDFEHVLAHPTMTLAENSEMQRFSLWARATAEHMLLRHIWAPLLAFAGMTQSAVIISLLSWFERSPHPAAVHLSELAARLRRRPSSVPTFLTALYGEPALDELLTSWWREAILPAAPPQHADLLDEILRYDCLSRPVFDPHEGGVVDVSRLEVVDVDGEAFYRHAPATFAYDVPALLRALREGHEAVPTPSPTEVVVYCKVGFHAYFANHEEAVYFVGQTWEELRQAKQLAEGAAPLLTAAVGG